MQDGRSTFGGSNVTTTSHCNVYDRGLDWELSMGKHCQAVGTVSPLALAQVVVVHVLLPAYTQDTEAFELIVNLIGDAPPPCQPDAIDTRIVV